MAAPPPVLSHFGWRKHDTNPASNGIRDFLAYTYEAGIKGSL